MTGFVNRIFRSTVWDTVESIKTKLSDVVFARYGGKRGIERSVNNNIVDFVVASSRYHSKPLIDSKGKEFQKSEIGLQIERSDTSSDRVCHACACKIRHHNFISSSLQKEKQAIDVPDDSSRCKSLLPMTINFHRLICVLFCFRAEDQHCN